MVTWEQLAYIMEGTTILAMLFSARETIQSKMYGIRYKKWVEIDTGRMGYVIIDESLKQCKLLDKIKTIKWENIKYNVMYFVSDNVENLKVEDAKEKYQFYCNSDEFGTVYKNKLLETLMLSLQNNKLVMILIAIVLVAGLIGYSIYMNQQTADKINFIAWKVNSTYGYGIGN